MRKVKKELLEFDEKGNLNQVQSVQEIIKITKRKYKKGEFIMQSIEFDKLVIKKKYSGLTFRVLSALKLRYSFNNEIKHFTQKQLATELETSQANVSRELKRLVDDKILILEDGIYYFNSKYFTGSGNNQV